MVLADRSGERELRLQLIDKITDLQKTRREAQDNADFDNLSVCTPIRTCCLAWVYVQSRIAPVGGGNLPVYSPGSSEEDDPRAGAFQL